MPSKDLAQRAATQKRLYLKYKAAGLANTPEKAAWKRAWIAKRKLAGLCTECGKSAAKNRTRCKACSDRYSDRFLGIGQYRATALLGAAKRRAKLSMVSCTITKPWIMDNLASGRCALTNIPFGTSRWAGSATNPYAPSIDRIQAGGPYSPENCRIILCGLNIALRDWGQEVFKAIASAYIARN